VRHWIHPMVENRAGEAAVEENAGEEEALVFLHSGSVYYGLILVTELHSKHRNGSVNFRAVQFSFTR
ncbi:hypothetical protein A2U01_0053708, partial [Trifolium medium]|nr:hypothetical protein [Trifolium medium]